MRLLAPWQEGRAKELLAANLEGGILLKDLSVEFDLSAGHFTRVFRRSTGMTPHRWLQTRRIESAKRMLLPPTARGRLCFHSARAERIYRDTERDSAIIVILSMKLSRLLNLCLASSLWSSRIFCESAAKVS